jgi:hypothetical protein
LPFPFDEMPHPPFGLELTWSLEQVIGYASSWSATANYRKALHEDPLPLLRQRLREVWPEQAATQSLRMPLVLRAGNLRAR